MADITRAAGLSTGIVNLHFESKEKLLVETLRSVANEYKDGLDEIFNDESISSAEKLLAHVNYDFSKKIVNRNKLSVWFAFWGEARSRPVYSRICAKHDKDMASSLTRLFTELIKEGADYIKISATGGSTRTSFPLLPAFNPDELRAMTQEAHKFGKLTATHCASTQGTIDSLDAGVDMIIHCVFKDSNGEANFREDVAERIGSQGAYVNPTVHVARASVWSLQKRKEARGINFQEQPGLDAALWELEIRWTHLARLIDMGLKIITGSDSSWVDYKLGNTVYETECLVQAGMSPMQGILSLTSDAAKALGIDSVTGSLEAEKEADLIIVDGNPAEDINSLWNIDEVFLGGDRVDRGPESVLAGIRQHPPTSRPESSIVNSLQAGG
jgi:imidazolonepropionase-like amidohydrolase